MNDQAMTGTSHDECRPSPVDEFIELLERPLTEITWVLFVPTFENWCTARGWDVAYDRIEDESLAIFCQAN